MNRDEMLEEMYRLAAEIELGASTPAALKRITTQFDELDCNIDAAPDPLTRVRHRDGAPWYEALVPRRWHRCRTQTSGYVRFTFFERCACGAVRIDGRAWIDRNTRIGER